MTGGAPDPRDFGLDAPPRVLFLAERMVLGGAERHFVEKADHMRRLGCHVQVASSGGPYADELYRRGLPHSQIRCDVARPVELHALQADLHLLASLVRRERINVVNCMAGMPFILSSILWELTGVPVAYEVLSPFYCMPQPWAAALRRIVEDVGGFYAISPVEAANQLAQCQLPEAAARIIPLSVDLEVFHPRDGSGLRHGLGLGADATVLLTVSRLAPEKLGQLEAIVRAAAAIGRDVPELVLVIVGDGPSRAGLEAVARRCDHLRTIFTGATSDVAPFYSLADVYVGTGMTAQEAAACERPVVLTNIAAGAAHLSVGYWGDDAETEVSNGAPYPGCRLRPVEELIRPLLADPGLRTRLGRRGRQAIVERFSAAGVNERWFAEFCRLAALRAPRPAAHAV